jgi:hypothetical protein
MGFSVLYFLYTTLHFALRSFLLYMYVCICDYYPSDKFIVYKLQDILTNPQTVKQNCNKSKIVLSNYSPKQGY